MNATRRRKPARRKSSTPAGYWFLAGLLSGLAAAAFLYYAGYLPDRQDQPEAPTATIQPPAETELTEDPQGIAAGEPSSRYDFFTVLPEMEVVVPEQELSRESGPPGVTAPSGAGNYVLQVGSFRSAPDAEQLKARLALQGHLAEIQLVTVNDETWHRVRIGPIEGARRADEIRRSLQDNGIDTLVMKVN